MRVVRRESASVTIYLVCTIARPGPRAFTVCTYLITSENI